MSQASFRTLCSAAPHRYRCTRSSDAIAASASQHNTAQYSTTQHNTAQHNTAQRNTAQHSITQHNTTHHNTTQHNTPQHNTVQDTPHHVTPVTPKHAKQATPGQTRIRINTSTTVHTAQTSARKLTHLDKFNPFRDNRVLACLETLLACACTRALTNLFFLLQFVASDCIGRRWWLALDSFLEKTSQHETAGGRYIRGDQGVAETSRSNTFPRIASLEMQFP